MVDPAELDSKSQDIIWALEQLGGTADTGEIRRYTDLDNTTVITYRLNGKLGPDEYGLVTTEQPPMKNGRLQPKIATLTEKGETLAAKLDAQTPGGCRRTRRRGLATPTPSRTPRETTRTRGGTSPGHGQA